MELFKYISSLIWSELLGSIIWFFIGIIIMIILLIIINKTELFKKKTVSGKILKAIYFIVFPFVLGVSFWFYSATSSAKSAALDLVDASVNELEENVYPLFHTYIGEEINEYVDSNIDDIPTNDEFVTGFLIKEKLNDEGIVTSITHWVLVEVLVYIEDKAIESSVEKIGLNNKDIMALINHEEGLVIDKALLDAPFKLAKKQLYTLVSGVFSPYFFISIILIILIIVVLLLDVIITKKVKQRVDL